MQKNLLFIFLCLWSFQLSAQPPILLEAFANGLESPVDIANAGDDRLFVVEQRGIIKIVQADGTLKAAPFLDIDDQVRSGGERGLLGLAFHPNYTDNGYFFVNYTNNNGSTVIARFEVAAGSADLANPASEKILMTIGQPYVNHNGGDLNFGPDGYLYIGMGDGGAGGDPENNSQNRTKLLGKMLRIDVDNGDPYAIPADNPFAEDDFTLDEIWSIGLRNPWRFSFDRLTGDMWIADVGQNAYEEIDFQPASSTGGENYGWRCKEGFANFDFSGDCNASDLVEPIHDYVNSNSVGCSVTGGYVYRGSEYPSLNGKYIYADFCTGRFWAITQTADGNFENKDIGQFSPSEYSSFGEDANGELYVAALSSGRILKVTDACAGAIEATISVSGLILSAPTDYAAYQWLLNGIPVEGANDTFLEATENGEYSVQITDENGCVAVSNVISMTVLSIHESDLTAFLQVAPNPFDNKITLTITTDTPLDVRAYLTDVSGVKIWEKSFRANRSHEEIMIVDHLPRGVYLLTVEGAQGRAVKKVLKH